MKQAVAKAALEYVVQDGIIGVGSGSTVNCFIDALADIKGKIEGAVASSVETEKRLKSHGIPVYDLNSVNKVDVYIDGADEANEHGYLIKGLGGALTREKIVAASSEKFVCIIDETKKVTLLGEKSPVPIEVIPMARGLVARQIVKLGGNPVYRQGVQTDNGNIILDVHNLKLLDPVALEKEINAMVGVVENGLFAHNVPNVILVATEQGIEKINI